MPIYSVLHFRGLENLLEPLIISLATGIFLIFPIVLYIGWIGLLEFQGVFLKSGLFNCIRRGRGICFGFYSFYVREVTSMLYMFQTGLLGCSSVLGCCVFSKEKKTVGHIYLEPSGINYNVWDICVAADYEQFLWPTLHWLVGLQRLWVECLMNRKAVGRESLVCICCSFKRCP